MALSITLIIISLGILIYARQEQDKNNESQENYFQSQIREN